MKLSDNRPVAGTVTPARHDGGVDYNLVIAAAQAAGPCPLGEEASWGRRVHTLTVNPHMIAKQVAQDVDRLESAKTFVAFLEKVEIEETSRRPAATVRRRRAHPHRAAGDRPRPPAHRACADTRGTVGAGLPGYTR